MKLRTVVLATGLLSVLGSLAALSTARAQTRSAGGGEIEHYEIDPVHSTVIFRINHLGVSHFYGRINGPFGEFAFSPDDPADSVFKIRIRAKNVDTNNPNRDGHIKSADFLNARQFPEITFTSKHVAKAGDNTYQVTGDLALHGVTKSIDVQLEHVGTKKLPRFGHRCGFATTFTIKRSDFGVTYMPELLGDDVTLMIGIEGQKK